MFKLFRGGIHPADGKTLAREGAIETMPAPALVTLRSSFVSPGWLMSIRMGVTSE